MNATKKLVITAMCAALCVVLPFAFHFIPGSGRAFSPMHIPVLLCGIVCGWQNGMICGFVGPMLAYMVTGMPQGPTLIAMMVELPVYGVASGALMALVRTNKIVADLYISMIIAMLVGRILAGLASAYIISSEGLTFAAWFSAYFGSALPGIITHLIVVPLLYLALEKARLIPARYPKKSA